LIGKSQLPSKCGNRLKNPVDWVTGEIMNDIGKMLVIAGAVMVAVGVVLWTGVGKHWLGRLPGDINYTRGNFSFHFPLVTCLLISGLLTVLLWIFRR
jgi:mannose/fructose/N-acetylgalactosamine-specific phosphotransferase system component IIC